LAEELTEMIPTQAGYDANLKAIQTEDEMLGALLDTVG
jgi:flagellar hook protein FlgE